MERHENIEDLKKKYEEVLMNTTKEAAARIIVSERKTVRLERELNASKEQAVQMLVRLKSMMDSKVSESQTKIEELEAQLQAEVSETRTHSSSQEKKIAELEAQVTVAQINSLNQQKNIDKLEAQLEEREDVIKEVREELSEVYDELDRVRNNQLKVRKAETKSPATFFSEKFGLDPITEVYNSQEQNSDNDNAEPDENPRLPAKLCTPVNCKRGSESVVSENDGLQSVCADGDKIDVPVVSSKEVVAGTHCDLLKESMNDGFTYTFQRRKKQCLSNSNSCTSVLNKILKEEELEKQKNRLENVKSTSMAESP